MRLPRPLTFLGDREYAQNLLKFALPIAFQQLIFSGLSLVANVMVGQLGDTAVAAVALANQIFFLLNLVGFGIASGTAMFTAQFWGKRDIPNIRRVLGISLALNILTGLVFMLLAVIFPSQALSIYSKDPAVIELGSAFLRVFGFSFIFFCITMAYAFILRSIGIIRLPVIITVASLILNVFLSYLLIFGKLGFPELGAQGAAWSLLVSRILECLVLIFFVYRLKTPLAARAKELFTFDLAFVWRVLKPVLPVVINEILWSFGVTTYQAIYGRIGTDALASINIAFTIDGLAMVPFMGIANATSILVGNLIGEADIHKAHRYAGQSLTLAAFGGILVGAIVWIISPWIISLYKVSPAVIDYTQTILLIICLLLWLRMMNLVLFLGILRAGGDTRFALILDGVIIWVVGVPLTAFAAFTLQLPIYLVYLFIYSEEICKWAIGMWRFFSRRWVHNLAEAV